MHCRDMPGYPKVDRENDYLIARYDSAVLDAKPWGRGALQAASSAQSLGYTGQQAVVLRELLRKEVCLFQPLLQDSTPRQCMPDLLCKVIRNLFRDHASTAV